MQRKDIIRAASSLVAVFGEKAETMVERKIAGCMKAGYNVRAGIWKEIRTAIAQIRANEATMASTVRHDRPILLGDILGRLDIDVGAVPKRNLSLEFRKITRNCDECRHTAKCRRWLSGEGSKDAYRGFCPNAKIFDCLR